MIIEQLFLELFSVTQTCELNWHVVLEFAGQSDKTAGQVENSHGFTHVQHQDVAVLPDNKSLQNQRYRFRRNHKEAFNLRVRNGQRLVITKLLPQYRNNATTRAQYISKPY